MVSHVGSSGGGHWAWAVILVGVIVAVPLIVWLARKANRG